MIERMEQQRFGAIEQGACLAEWHSLKRWQSLEMSRNVRLKT